MQKQQIRPKLPQDTIFLPSEEGVVFRRAGRTLALKGKGVFQLIATLAPHLRGEATVDALTAAMSGNRATIVENLVTTLVDEEMLINHSKTDEDELSRVEKDVFRSQIEFLEHLTVNPCASFRRFREARIVLYGSGLPLAALASSLVRNGARNLAFDTDILAQRWAADIGEALAEMREQGVECSVSRWPLSLLDEASAGARPDAVCYASDADEIDLLLQLNRRFRQSATLFFPGVWLGNAVHLGPVVSEANHLCWECALLRYTDQCPSTEAGELWKHAVLKTPMHTNPWPESTPSMRIFANTLGFHVFRHLTGLASDAASILSLDIMTLESKTTPLLPHPQCRLCGRRKREAVKTFSEEPLEAWNEQIHAIEPLVAERFGVFGGFQDDTILQTPLFRSNLRTSRRTNLIEPSTVAASSLENNAAARLECIFKAAASYALSMKDPDWLLSRDELDKRGVKRIAGEELAGFMGCAGVDERNRDSPWVLGKSARTRETLALPAAAVFPAARREALHFEASQAGTGCAFSAAEAALKAAQSLWAFEYLKSVARGERRLYRCRVSSFPGDSYSLNCLQTMGAEFELWVANTAAFGVALSVRRPGKTSSGSTAVGYGASPVQAVEKAAKELLAMELGDDTHTSLQSFLPESLGYYLPALWGESSSDWIDLQQQNPEESEAGTDAMACEQDMVLCEITPRDLANCQLSVMRAVLLRDRR
jgi:bacteriocin biosynthesis cyclodehydratase domain-containing protein